MVQVALVLYGKAGFFGWFSWWPFIKKAWKWLQFLKKTLNIHVWLIKIQWYTGVKYFAQEHDTMSLSRAWTQIAWFGCEHSNYEATMSPSLSQSWMINYFLCYSGITGPSICFEFWDHSYVSVKSNQENSDTPLEKCPSPSTETLPSSSLPSQQELNGKSFFYIRIIK